MDAVVYAGGYISGALAKESGETIKALIPWGGKACISRVVDGLLESPLIERIAVVGSERCKLFLPLNRRVLFHVEGSGAVDNIARGINLLGLRGKKTAVLTCPGDLPLLNGEAVTDMIESFDTSCEIGISLAPKEKIKEEFPGSPNSYIRTRDGHYANTCLAIINAEMVDRFKQLLEDFHSSRKSQLKIAKRIGLKTLITYITGRLRIEDAVVIGKKLFDTAPHFDLNGSPSLAFDIDDISEYRYLKENWDIIQSKKNYANKLTFSKPIKHSNLS